MMAHNEVYLRCAQLANASRVPGNLGDDIRAICGDGLRRRSLRLTNLDGNVVRLRGSSLSFVLYLDHVLIERRRPVQEAERKRCHTL